MLDFEKIEKLISKGYITKRKHPTQDLWILNYTTRCQLDRNWNTETIACRGLIVNDRGQIVSRPFKKFFNVSELSYFRNHLHDLYGVKYSEIFNMPFQAYEKLDGSLGISYWDKKYRRGVSTRGSFESEQAAVATRILNTKYKDVELDRNLTYLFEIIYKDNRIVVDYGDVEDLYLIAVINTQSGEELSLSNFVHLPFPQPKLYEGIHGLEELYHKQEENKEGFVLNFGNGFRAKFKFDKYVMMHKILSDFTEKKILDNIIHNTFDNMIEILPDEFYKEALSVKEKYTAQYKSIEEAVLSDFNKIKHITDRKVFAQEAQKSSFTSCLFALYDGKSIVQQIWNKVKESRI